MSGHLDEQVFQTSNRNREDARRRTLSFALVSAIYALLGVAMLILSRVEPPPPVKEIPVEIVVAPAPEPPRPPPEVVKKPERPKPPDPSQAAAFDAPKEGVAETASGDKPRDVQPPHSDAPGRNAEKAEAQESTQNAEPSPPTPAPSLKSSDDGELAPPTSQAPTPAPAKPANPASKGKTMRFAALPQVEFGAGAAKAPVAGGEGPADYLNIVIGLVRKHLHKPPKPDRVTGLGVGVIVFRLDSDGRLIDDWFVQHSGFDDLDRAEEQALIAASPFPPPPYLGRAIEYRFNVD